MNWNNESTGRGMFLLGAVAGALVGAGVALLIAPKSGAEVRRDLNSGLNSVRDAAARRYRDLADRASARLGNIDSKVDAFTSRQASAMTDDGASGAIQS